jgi:riboflavin kinase / FMN adenylyltransferase
MQVYRSIAELEQIRQPVVLAFGVFDGLHLGHQEVLRRAQLHARGIGAAMLLFTFSPHPQRVLAPQHAPAMLCSLPHELLLLERLGVEHVLVCPFDKDLAATPAGAFITNVAHRCQRLAAIFVGETWRFGKGREGDVLLLQLLGKQQGFEAFGVPSVMLQGQVVSSTSIRQAVTDGDFLRASALLGRPYAVLGDVVKGRQLGRTLGFPTANLNTHVELLPEPAVYAVRATVAGSSYRGVANLGTRPTVDAEDAIVLEVHLFDFSGDLYGKQMEVEFVHHLRSQKKFESIDALKQQIASDAALARSLLV